MPPDGGVLHHVFGFYGNRKCAVRMSITGHRPGHNGDGIDGERLLIGVSASARVLEAGPQLVVARLLELELAAVRGQLAGHIVGHRDSFAVPGQRPAQGIFAQRLKAGNKRYHGIGVEHLRQIEAGCAHRVDLDGGRGGSHPTQLVRHAGGKGVKTRFGEETMPAAGAQIKRRRDLHAVPQNCPDHLIAAKVFSG